MSAGALSAVPSPAAAPGPRAAAQFPGRASRGQQLPCLAAAPGHRRRSERSALPLRYRRLPKGGHVCRRSLWPGVHHHWDAINYIPVLVIASGTARPCSAPAAASAAACRAPADASSVPCLCALPYSLLSAQGTTLTSIPPDNTPQTLGSCSGARRTL